MQGEISHEFAPGEFVLGLGDRCALLVDYLCFFLLAHIARKTATAQHNGCTSRRLHCVVHFILLIDKATISVTKLSHHEGCLPPAFLWATGTPVNNVGEDIERLFVVDYSSMHRGVPEAQLITYSAEKQVNQLQILHPRTQAIEVDKMSLVVSIDGACRDNGTPTARASWGVFFRPRFPIQL